MLYIYLQYCFLPVIFTNDEAFNMFLNQDPIFVYSIILVPTIIHGIITYSFINNTIYFNTNTNYLIHKYCLFML